MANSSVWKNITDAVTQMSEQNNLHGAFILSTIGGLVTLGSGVFLSIWFMTGGLTLGGMMSGLSSLMSGFHEMMGSLGIPFSFMSGLSLIGLIAGLFIIVSAMMLRMQPYAHTLVGTHNPCILVHQFPRNRGIPDRRCSWHHRWLSGYYVEANT
jgi:hypothetical protein